LRIGGFEAMIDLQQLRAFIARDNPLATRRKIDALRRSIRSLVD